MAIGFPVTKQSLDNHIGQLGVQLRDALVQCQRAKVVVDGVTDAQIEALGYSAGERAKIRAIVTDLNNLARVANGLQAQPGASDFFFNARDAMGLV